MTKRKYITIIFVISILTISPIVYSQNLSTKQIVDNKKSININNTTVLVAGFGPFLSYNVNPSELIALELDGETISGAGIIGLPVQVNLSNFSESIEYVYQAIEFYNPDYVLLIGLNPSKKKIRIEKIGINFKKEMKENQKLEKLIPNGRLFRFSHLPGLKIVFKLRNEKIPSTIGFYAGVSLCNGMLYSLLHHIDVKNLDIKSGFIHVPLHKTEENPEGMELETMFNATRIIIDVCLDHFS